MFVIVFVVFILVPSPCQCSSVVGEVFICLLPVKDDDPHHLCTSCRDKTCDIKNRCRDCHDWPNEKCRCVGE